jgi:hypothetical protein
MKNTFNLQARDQQCSDHPMHLNWSITNKDGNPALCCSVCTSTTKQRLGKPRYIRFIKTKEIEILQQMDIEERFI